MTKNNNTTELHRAASRGDIEGVKLLVSQGVKIDAKDEHGWTPLHVAVLNGDESYEVVKWLVANGADIHARDDVDATPGNTPLDLAKGEKGTGHDAVIEFLTSR